MFIDTTKARKRTLILNKSSDCLNHSSKKTFWPSHLCNQISTRSRQRWLTRQSDASLRSPIHWGVRFGNRIISFARCFWLLLTNLSLEAYFVYMRSLVIFIMNTVVSRRGQWRQQKSPCPVFTIPRRRSHLCCFYSSFCDERNNADYLLPLCYRCCCCTEYEDWNATKYFLYN